MSFSAMLPGEMVGGSIRGLCLAAAVTLVVAASAGAKTYKVTTTADHKPKACSGSDCTLREAVRAANRHAGRDRIVLRKSKKPYRLTRSGASEDKAKKGDLDLTDAAGVLIRGAKPNRAVIRQATPDRVLEITAATDGFVTLSKVTVTGGDVPGLIGGGGIRTVGLLNLNGAVVTGNQANSGGGIVTGSDGTAQVIMRRSSVTGNTSGGAGGGLALLRLDYDTEIEASTISGNHAGRGGAIWANPDLGETRIVNSTIANNTAVEPDPPTAPATGGGITVVDFGADDVGPLFQIEFSTIAGNESLPGRAANVISGYPIQLQNTIVADAVGAVSCGGDQDSHGYNVDEGGTSCDLDQGTDQEGAGADAALGPLQKNGGPTRTMGLEVGSDALSDGDCTPSFALPGFDLTVDQRGVSRPRPAVDTDCDVGAWEGFHLIIGP